MEAKRTKLMNHLVEIRKNLVTDRVKKIRIRPMLRTKGGNC